MEDLRELDESHSQTEAGSEANSGCLLILMMGWRMKT